MARPIWTGHLSFGLVMIPVGLYSGESPARELNMTMLDSRDKARIRYQRINENTGKEVPWKSIVKGYELDPGEFVVVTPEDFKRAAVHASKTIEISDFVDRKEIPPAYFSTPYYLEPVKNGEKGYVVLRDTLKRTGRAGIATVVIHSRQHLAAIYDLENAIVMDTLRFADELRDPAELHLPGKSAATKATSRELEMAEKLVEGMSAAWDPSKYHDRYRESLLKWIEQKARAGGKTPAAAPEGEEDIPGPYNLMELLRKSVEGKGVEGKRAGPARRAGAAAHAKSRPAPSRRKAG